MYLYRPLVVDCSRTLHPASGMLPFYNICYRKSALFSCQEPKTDKDEEFCRKVNEYLNNPPIPGALGSGGGGHELSALGGKRCPSAVKKACFFKKAYVVLRVPSRRRRSPKPSGQHEPQPADAADRTDRTRRDRYSNSLSHKAARHLPSREIKGVFFFVA